MSDNTKKVVVRMPPSPTGNLHIGTARTFLFNYLFAKSHDGHIVFRSEDTDTERSKREYEDNIIEGLHWLGLSWDEFYRQSERTEIYVSYIKKMLENGTAYISDETQHFDGHVLTKMTRNGPGREKVIRFKNPNKKVAFDDLIRGTIEVDTTDLGDFVIAKSETEPLYHLAVVVDDHEMGVTHVIRGEDHISNTPRQILIQEAIGASRPVYAHLPLIVDNDKQKLSKRKHGPLVWIDTYKEQGYLPDALLNFYALMGWNPGTEQEIFSLQELIQAFDISRSQKSAAVYNIDKLRWINKEHMKKLDREVIRAEAEKRIEHNIPDELLEVITERIEVFSDIDEMKKAGEFDYYFVAPILDPDKIAWKQSSREEAKENLGKVLEILPDADAVMKLAEERGKGAVLWPLRYSLSGKEKSPDPFTLMKILGAEETKSRVQKAIELL